MPEAKHQMQGWLPPDSGVVFTMNLPLFLDIALGLIFVYLTLSLLASELQELVATLLQWRAEHLKKSIEVLFSGKDLRSLPGIEYADRIYESPLISALNQEARGPLARFFRIINQRIGESYRFVTRTRNVFGRFKSGPSYIPSQTFSAALIADLRLGDIRHRKSQEYLKNYINDKLNAIDDMVDCLHDQSGDSTLLNVEFSSLKERLRELYQDTADKRLEYRAAIDEAGRDLLQFVTDTEAVLKDDPACAELIRRRMPYLKQSIGTRKAEPTIAELIEVAIAEKDYLPDSFKENLRSLAEDVQAKSTTLIDGARRFEDELGNWFDRSMERATGVYKRNAKGIAIIIGFLIALSMNADTIYVVNRLSKDTLLRTSIGQAANQVVIQPIGGDTAGLPGDRTSQAQRLEELREAVDESLEALPLPLGWNPIILEEQREQAAAWQFPIIRRILGWLITGIAISMGSSFWYGILGRIINVRNTGRSPSEKKD